MALIRGCLKLTISRAIRAAFCNALSTIRKSQNRPDFPNLGLAIEMLRHLLEKRHRIKLLFVVEVIWHYSRQPSRRTMLCQQTHSQSQTFCARSQSQKCWFSTSPDCCTTSVNNIAMRPPVHNCLL